MTTATELTLALGRTVYGGDPADDEKVQSREVRVSVTWTLTEDEQDLSLTVSVLAEEAQRALDHADRVARRAAASQATEPATSGAAGNGHAALPAPGQTFGSGFGQTPANGQNFGAGGTPPCHGGYSAPSKKDGKQPGKVVPVATSPCASRPEAITAPQRLAIRSLCTRMEVASTELTLLLDERFGKRRLEELDKAEAATLLDALQRGAWEGEAETPAYGN